MTQKDVTLYYYVDLCFQILAKDISFENHLRVY
jgi:hypothetical protein